MATVILYILYALLALVGIWVARKLHFAFTHFKVKQFTSGPALLESLPSVSVCIPARNETHAMTQCLERVIQSSYPKLEVIVLDDGSVDNTSILIKSFAHAGVRFVEGSPLPEGWLGKNHALEGLRKEASGTYILFMDVDTHITHETIGQLVAYATAEEADVVSVLPRREDVWRASVYFATLRYFWELILHRPTVPATASAAWMINRQLLNEGGGFEPHRKEVQPEVHLAAQSAAQGRYRFLISTAMLGVSYEKKWSSQIETETRLAYPRFGGRFFGMCAAILGLGVVLVPFVVLPIAATQETWLILGILSAVLSSGFVVLYAVYLWHVWARNWWVGALLLPLIVVQELSISIVSWYRYLTGTVTWKGRSITVSGRQAAAPRHRL